MIKSRRIEVSVRLGSLFDSKKLKVRPVMGGSLEIPRVSGKEDRCVIAVQRYGRTVTFDEPLDHRLPSRDPARALKGRTLKTRGNLVFRNETGGENIKLKLANDANDPISSKHRTQNLAHALLRQVLKCAP
jgi:hypothetical protein